MSSLRLHGLFSWPIPVWQRKKKILGLLHGWFCTICCTIKSGWLQIYRPLWLWASLKNTVDGNPPNGHNFIQGNWLFTLLRWDGQRNGSTSIQGQWLMVWMIRNDQWLRRNELETWWQGSQGKVMWADCSKWVDCNEDLKNQVDSMTHFVEASQSFPNHFCPCPMN